ncbi:MAG: hypothetical protein HRU15_13130, partial [Planctomycetes bacterium]|nr:hypothetical protein [Planctomycetota bacterium]
MSMYESTEVFSSKFVRWIWPKDCVQPNAHVLFRKDLILDEDVKSCLHMAAETFAQVYIDGQFIHRYNSVSYPNQHYYESIDLGVLAAGEHSIAIVVHYVGIPSGATWVKDPGLIVHLDLESHTVYSDEHWSAYVSNAWKGQCRRAQYLNMEFIEELDFNDLPPHWPMLPLEDCTAPLALNPYPGCRMPVVEQRNFPFVQSNLYVDYSILSAGHVQDLSVQHGNPAVAISHEGCSQENMNALQSLNQCTIPALDDGQAFTILMKLGNYITGYPRLEMEATQGMIVDIAWHEYCDEEKAYLDLVASGLYATDRFILADGINIVQPEEWKAMRYVQLTFRNGSGSAAAGARARIINWSIEQTQYPLAKEHQLQCEHEKLQKIIDISLNAVRLCMHGIIMDCPWREKRQWIGDVQRIALINHYSFQDQLLVRAVLRQHANLQQASGQMWACQPLAEEYPTQSMEWLRAVCEYQEHTGDCSLVSELRAQINLLAQWFARHINDDGVLFIDDPRCSQWMENSLGDLREYSLLAPCAAMSLSYVQFLQDMALLAEDAGDKDQYQEEAEILKRNIKKYFYDEELGLIQECRLPQAPVRYSEMTHAMAVSLQLPDIDAADLWQHF